MELVFGVRAPLQVLGSVVSLVAVDVIDEWLVLWVWHPCHGDHSVDSDRVSVHYGPQIAGGSLALVEVESRLHDRRVVRLIVG